VVRYRRAMTKKRATSYRLSDEARKYLVVMSRWRGVGQTAVLEWAIRDAYARELLAVAKVREAQKGGAR